MGFRWKEREGSFDLYFHYSHKSTWLTLKLRHKGKLKKQCWNSQTNTWEREWVSENSDCDIYGKCGRFGICNSLSSPICSCLRGFEPKNKEEWRRQNWTSGCVRREALQCDGDKNSSQDSKPDGFLKLERVKLPDHAEVFSSNFDQHIADCQTQCLKHCSCIAYAYDRSLGCMVWNVDLLDTQNFPVDTGRARRKMTTPIIISALVGTILIMACGYFLWGKKKVKPKRWCSANQFYCKSSFKESIILCLTVKHLQ